MNRSSAIHRKGIKASIGLALSVLMIIGTSAPPLSIATSMADGLGCIELSASSALPGVSEGNAQYSLEGAEYFVYSDYECSRYVGTLKTDESGNAQLQNVPTGRYFVHQETPSRGFSKSGRLYQVEVAQSRTSSLEAISTPYVARPEVLIQEMNEETQAQTASSGLALGNAQYEVSYYDGTDESRVLDGCTRSWTLSTDDQGQASLSDESLVAGSPLYVNGDGEPVMPLGYYTIVMTRSPQGYLDSNDILACTIEAPQEAAEDPIVLVEPVLSKLKTIRGDLMFRKVDENGNPLSAIPFLLTHANIDDSIAPESHVVVTNEQGDFSSNAEYVSHSQHVNANDEAIVSQTNDVYKIDESKLSCLSGTWFSQDEEGNRCEPEDSKGALPYGSYILQELPCSKNEGMNLSTVRFSVYQDQFTVKLDNIVNTRPSISGFAFDSSDYDKLVKPKADASVTEVLDYRNLVVGQSYTVIASASVKETGEEIASANNMPSTKTLALEPSDSMGSVTLQLDLDTSEIAGRTITISSKIIAEDGQVLAQTNEETSQNELKVEPKIIATAQDALDGDKYVMGSDASILECVEYAGLTPGNRYVIECNLNDKATGNALRDAQGMTIANELAFIPKESQGHVDVTLPIDTSAIQGHDIVVFDKMLDAEGEIIASSQSMDDEDHTVKTVKLTSNAVDKSDGDKLFDSKSSNVAIVDTVSYANLVPGKQYEIDGVLMDKDTGTALIIDGVPVTASASFVPKEVSGSVDVEYAFDATAQSSQVLVAFESIEHEGNVVAQDADLENVAQTITSEDVDPDAATVIADDENPLDGFGSPKMGDLILRFMIPTLAIVGLTCLGIAIAVHRHRRSLEAIARSNEQID